MVLCAGLLIYGTESDEKYLKAVVVRWGISFAIYVALVHAYFALEEKDLVHFQPSFHVIQGLVTQASYINIYFYMERREVQGIS